MVPRWIAHPQLEFRSCRRSSARVGDVRGGRRPTHDWVAGMRDPQGDLRPVSAVLQPRVCPTCPKFDLDALDVTGKRDALATGPLVVVRYSVPCVLDERTAP